MAKLIQFPGTPMPIINEPVDEKHIEMIEDPTPIDCLKHITETINKIGEIGTTHEKELEDFVAIQQKYPNGPSNPEENLEVEAVIGAFHKSQEDIRNKSIEAILDYCFQCHYFYFDDVTLEDFDFMIKEQMQNIALCMQGMQQRAIGRGLMNPGGVPIGYPEILLELDRQLCTFENALGRNMFEVVIPVDESTTNRLIHIVESPKKALDGDFAATISKVVTVPSGDVRITIKPSKEYPHTVGVTLEKLKDETQSSLIMTSGSTTRAVEETVDFRASLDELLNDPVMVITLPVWEKSETGGEKLFIFFQFATTTK